MSKHPFEHFNLDENLIEAVKNLNFEKPTEIQNRIIPRILKGTNLIGQSQTGTGKSHAFLLPLIQLIESDIQEPQAIVVAPTRELAQQLYQVAMHLVKFKKGINVKLFIGGTDLEKDKQRCSHQPQLTIGTPTRINDLAHSGYLHAHLASYLIIDEADLMIDLGLIEDVDHIAARLDDENAHLAVFSATIPKSLQPFLNKYLSQPEFVEVDGKAHNKENIELYLIPTKGSAKVDKTLELIDILNPYLCIIFCNSRENADELADTLNKEGIKIGMIHGGLTPRERKQQMKRIRNLDFQFVIASDLASRGIDITLYGPDEESNITLIEERGYKFKNVDIKNGELKPIKAHNMRKSRQRKDDHLTNEVKHKVRSKSKRKVKPGYKKKFKQEVEKMKRQERKQYSKKQKRQKRKTNKG
ncbi:MAG: DEAD/DEAH box helicase [Staphylococcus epidermidis]|nr:DEAD/DEAH box helicase [Staphylococcus epidermidis]